MFFFYVVGTHTKCIINDFSPAPRTNIWIFKCHTVTHGTDLRKSPLNQKILKEKENFLTLFKQFCTGRT